MVIDNRIKVTHNRLIEDRQSVIDNVFLLQQYAAIWSAKRDKNTIVDYRLSIFDSIGDVRFDCRLPIVDLRFDWRSVIRLSITDCRSSIRLSIFDSIVDYRLSIFDSIVVVDL